MEENILWQKCLENISKEVSYSNFKVFFENTRMGQVIKNENGYVAEIFSGSAFSAQSLYNKYGLLIGQCLEKILGEKTIVNILVGQVNKKKKVIKKVKQEMSSSLFDSEVSQRVEEKNKARLFQSGLNKSRLRPEYSFENFAVSPTNEVAYAAALAVAKRPAKAYNPLFLYGDVGVGKTHLMHGIGIRILQNKPEVNIVYCMGEQFTNEIIEAIRTKKTPNFRAKYREAEVLFIDDIQFIAGKDHVQEEFFHTFNAITSNGGQVVLTSDRPPHEIKLLEDRLRSRFEEGLTIDIQAPSFELRTAILLIKAKQMGKDLAMDTAQTIAEHISSTRKLQGVLSELYAVSEFKKLEVNPILALQIIKKKNFADDMPNQRAYISPKDVIDTISRHYNIAPKLIYGQKRNRQIVAPRQYAMYLLNTDLKLAYAEIGRILGNRDHTTIMHGVDKISKLVSESEEMRGELSTLKKEIYG